MIDVSSGRAATAARRSRARVSAPVRAATTAARAAPASASRRRRLVRATTVMTGYALVLGLAAFFVFALRGAVTTDFHGTIWEPGRAILHGRSPYPAPDAAALQRALTPSIYPPAILVATLPVAALPAGLAIVVWNAVNVLALLAALRLVGLRDRRCYAIALLAPPMLGSLAMGQLNGLLALGVAAAWRYRGRMLVPAVALAGLVAVKLFLWPLGVWFLVRGSHRAAIVATCGALAATFAAWAAIGFDGLAQYPRLLAADAEAFQTGGRSLVALATQLGLTPSQGRLAAVAVGAALLASLLGLRRGPVADRRAFVLALAAAFALSPLLWRHYLVILLVPLALARPRFDRYWIAFAVLSVLPTDERVDSLPLALVAFASYAVPLAVSAGLCRGALSSARPGGSARARFRAVLARRAVAL